MRAETLPCQGRVTHPTTEALERFMGGRMERREAAEVVRHLLRGCPECRKRTGALWRLADGEIRRTCE